MSPPALLRRVLIARGLRAFADGYVSLLLPLYLLALGMSPFQVGVIATATLLGSGVLTLLVGLQAWRFRGRTLMLAAAVLMTATGAGFATLTDFWPLLAIAVVGTLNASNDDVSMFLPLEHALLSRLVEPARRTAAFASYSLVGALVAAGGALAAGLPSWLAASLHIDSRTTLQAMFMLYAAIGVACALLYRTLPDDRLASHLAPAAPLGPSRGTVLTLAALFSLDALGGGFVVQSMLALYLYTRFDLPVAVAGKVFFCTGVLSAVSFFFVARVARRLGLLNTMVFSHLPASLLLILIPLMPSAGWAVGLLLLRSTISSLDVPTRSSHVMAIVTPPERAAAAGLTTVPRSLVSALGPLIAGFLLTVSSFGWPLLIAGVLKIAYDAMLFMRFHSVSPPHEGEPAATGSTGTVRP